VSITAVSKWERGECYPDIELLPRIAVFYDTTVDDLLGVGETRKKQKISEYRQQNSKFWKSGDSLACVEHWRNAAKEFPNDNDVMFKLLIALSNAIGGLKAFPPGDKDREAKQNEFLKEAVEIGEALSAKATDQHIMYTAMYRLCVAYKELGEVEKAVQTANKLPEMWLSKEESLLSILEGAELKAHSQNFLLRLIDSFGNVMAALRRCDYDDEQIIRIYGKAIQIIKLFFEDGDYGTCHNFLNGWYLAIAVACAKMNDADAVIENLSAAAEHAIAYDLLEENVPHTSLLFNTLKTQKSGKTYMSNESQNLLKQMAAEHFNFCRDDERFVKLVEDLKKVAVSGE
jgi:transcriptional regulator with XRE-family HTH domain